MTDQYSSGTKPSISASRSQINRTATDCTRPALARFTFGPTVEKVYSRQFCPNPPSCCAAQILRNMAGIFDCIDHCLLGYLSELDPAFLAVIPKPEPHARAIASPSRSGCCQKDTSAFLQSSLTPAGYPLPRL